MKLIFLSHRRAHFLQLVLAIFGWPALLAAQPAVKLPNPQTIQDVAAGKHKVVQASWWGFDPTDATAALQAAINSGAVKVVVENLGAPWVVDQIQLAGHQELLFEPGVVVLAKRGAFRGKGDSLFSATLKTNLTLTGYGATLKMWQQDYDSKDYPKAEWRHVLNLRSCSRVRVAGLTLADSGGDGIYLGVARPGMPNTDIGIQDVVCLNNYRQGISVISAENLLLENCVFRDTGGTAPQAGIDFEPNLPGEKLAHCVLRRCVSENNRGNAFEFYLKALNGASSPVSIRLEDCRSKGGRQAVGLSTGNGPEHPAVKGLIEFSNCRFEESVDAGLSIQDKPASGCNVRFVNCEWVNPAANQPALSPFAFATGPDNTESFGGLEFLDCVLKDPLERPPMSYLDAVGLPVVAVTGTLTVERNQQRTIYALDQKLIDTWLPHQVFKEIKPFVLADARYEPVAAPPPATNRVATARQRGHAEYLIWAEAGQDIFFTVFVQPVGKTAPPPARIRVVAPSAKAFELASVPNGQPAPRSFAAKESGAYIIVCEAGQATTQVTSDRHRVCLYSEKSSFHLLGTTGELFFWVPAGISEFGLKVVGGGGIERVQVALCAPSGQTVAERDGIDRVHQFVAQRPGSAPGEIWSLRLDKPSAGVLEDYYLQMQGVPPLLACGKDSLLHPASPRQP